MKRAQPLTLGENNFPSLTAAAKHFNMSLSTVSRRHSNGESYAEIFGVNEPEGAKGKAQGRAKQISVNGQTFKSIAEFARHHNLDPVKVRARLHNNESAEEIAASAKKENEQYQIDGKTFSSVKSLAKHYNMSPKKLQENLDSGLSIAQAVGVSFVPHTQSNNAMSMVIDDNAYYSLDEIVTAFNLDKTEFIGLIAEQHSFQEAVNILRERAVADSNTEASLATETETKSTVDTAPRKKWAKPITVAGVEYPSESAAAKAHGLSPSAFYQRRKQGLTPEEALGINERAEEQAENSAPVDTKRKRVPVEATAARSKSIICDGKTYSSQRALARAFGISPHSLRYALSNGKTPEEAVGLQKSKPSERKAPHHNAKQITYKGKDYKSIRELSDAFGLPVANVRYRLNKGDSLDNILGMQDEVEEQDAVVESTVELGPQSVTYRGKQYRSIRAFAQHFNCDPAQVRYRLKNDWTPAQAIGRSEPPKKELKSATNLTKISEIMPVSVNDKTYHTAKALADDFGLKSSVVSGRLRNGWSPQAAVEIVPHRVGKKSSFLRIENRTFHNARELADAYGVPYRTVQYRLSQGASAPESVGLKDWKGKPHRGKSVTFDGKEYSSKKELAEAHGVDYNKFLSRIARGWHLADALNKKELSDSQEKVTNVAQSTQSKTKKAAKQAQKPQVSKASAKKTQQTKTSTKKAQQTKSKVQHKTETPNKLSGPIKMGMLTFSSVADFASKLNLDPHLVANRLSDDWTPEQIAGLQKRP
ncbi:MAG: hypothetical protein CBC55_01485 [Gammaproteobacteria bacterium TMED95]|nr:MAG: hypothetical protein CBC55_01485 [Gammaproteobacteria bacterium TMED95]|tara:strand:- start:3623 stop:5905 length:2283 start_codon:yes stop_codon:yes gene_type:complete